MAERFAQLGLYFGICVNDALISEGNFDENANEKGARLRYAKALGVVLNYVNPWTPWAVTIGSINPLVQNEQEGQSLVEHARQYYPGATGSLRLRDALHSKIAFFRSIIFPGADSSRRDEIITLMKQSGYQPKDKVREHEMKELGSLAGTPEGEALLVEMGCDPDRLWRENLKFF